jgi:hypothetical protein
MSNENTQTFLWDKLILPVIILVLAFMGTWVFSINTDVAVIKKSMTAVDTLVTDQRAADRMMILLEAQTKANTELVNEMKGSQRQLTDAVNEMKLALAKCCSKNEEYQFGRTK